MKKIFYITGNEHKFRNASTFLQKSGIKAEQKKLKLTEIQAEDAVSVALKKARDAYEIVNEPLFINDASWHIPALNGFPGPYMHNIVNWFDSDDLLNLMAPKKDRTIILKDTIIYKDRNHEKVFTNNIVGCILKHPTEGDGPFVRKIVSLEKGGKSLAETNTIGFSDRERVLWDEFALWVKRNLP
ncbi:MAG TPA: non-canonical purine NTP pyrophosphatase [Candidatus Saccharibacteria bacterium]|jgi:XTP/dITP diphosphohydrolase|nr:non-canonical purine NTP pyrophosphatase [Candidatus Saccharibacteria bacterium]